MLEGRILSLAAHFRHVRTLCKQPSLSLHEPSLELVTQPWFLALLLSYTEKAELHVHWIYEHNCTEKSNPDISMPVNSWVSLRST